MKPLRSFTLRLIVGDVWLIFNSVENIIRQVRWNLPDTVFLYERAGATIELEAGIPHVIIEMTTGIIIDHMQMNAIPGKPHTSGRVRCNQQ
jgi:hypothetical protein